MASHGALTSTLIVPSCPQPRATALAFNGTISLGEVATIVTNIVIAFILQRYLARRSESRKAEKDILAGHINDVFTAMRDCQTKFQSVLGKKPTHEEAQAIIVAVERISTALVALATAFRFSHCKDLETHCENLTPLFLQYKRALTGNSFPNRKFTGLEHSEGSALNQRLSTELHSLLFRSQKHR